MAILIDPPRWPAHGILWAHLVSNRSLEELHAFARQIGLPRRSFDLDHYDVAEHHHDRAVRAGASPVSGQELVRALRASGLRVPQAHRERMKSVHRRSFLQQEWARLGARLGVSVKERWQALGENLIQRWDEPHRRYHDLRHLEDVLLALDHLETLGETVSPNTVLAAWFHDAVYAGRAGEDERASAVLAADALSRLELPSALVTEVHAFILATIPGTDAAEVPRALAQLLDADLAVFGAGEKRYREYAAAVREEYAQIDLAAFRAGRAAILSEYLARPHLYRLAASRQLWEARARLNLAHEVGILTGDDALNA